MARSLLAVIVALVACGPRAKRWEPDPVFNTVVIDGALVLRGEVDGSILVLEEVRFDARSAFGTVRVRTTIDAVARSPHRALARARGWQVLAKSLAADVELAFAVARRGVDELLGCCAGNDTTMYVNAAEHMLVQLGERAAGLDLMHRMLDDLIRSYVRRHHPIVQ